jgi:hypothetical protein
MRGDARALRGLVPTLGFGLVGAFLLRPVRPVLIGGAAAKAFFAPPILQAVLACAVCVGAAETVVHVSPASRNAAPKHVKALDSAPVIRAAVSGTPAAVIRSSGATGTSISTGRSGAGSGSSTLAADRHAATLKPAADRHGSRGRGGRDDGQSGGSGRDGGDRSGTGPGALTLFPGARENGTKGSGDGGDSGPSTQAPSGSGSSGSDRSGDSGSGGGGSGPTVQESDGSAIVTGSSGSASSGLADLPSD